jgi:NAD(P)-dependent dehydrogenase (short-subunit alcohol dehydrogenase family)
MLPLLAEGSVIVNNLSIAARTAFPGMAAYNASKRGLLAFTETLREELRPRGIRVVALLPGATDTAIWEQFWPQAPRKRMISPRTVAAAVASAVMLPANANIDELLITPSAGAL